MSALDCVVFDMDGTLANNSHRTHHLMQKPKNWDAYNATMADDVAHPHIVALAHMFLDAGTKILICTGREECYRGVTEEWLAAHGIEWTRLLMRPNKDYRADHIVKMEMLAELRRRGHDPQIVVDDRSSVVAAWRAAGLTCLQCAPGEF